MHLNSANLSSRAKIDDFVDQAPSRFTNQTMGWVGVLGFLAAWFLTWSSGIEDPVVVLATFLTCAALPMLLMNLLGNKTYTRPTSGLLPLAQPVHWQRCGVKFVGFLTTLGILALLYRWLPEYQKESYEPALQLLGWLALGSLPFSFSYIIWVDRRAACPEDGLWSFGLLVLWKWKKLNRPALREYILGWVVKGFFLPFLMRAGINGLQTLGKYGWQFETFPQLYSTSLVLLMAVDAVLGVVGYLLTMRILDSQIRSTDKTVLGWLSALACYAPFSAVTGMLFTYKGNTDWRSWLADYPVLYISWGFLILLLMGFYLWATICFGCRFSNLTHRGIIVDGPYQFVKHPAYVAKNIAWWLMAVPFVVHAHWSDALRACLSLLCVNLIYTARAWTEERHLAQDSAYRKYSEWMSQHSLAAGLKRFVSRLLQRPSSVAPATSNKPQGLEGGETSA